MSRLVLVALLFALLTLSLAPSAAADCPNACSKAGVCLSSGSSYSCNCTLGYLGVDCSITTSMAPLCWVGGSICSHWAVSGGYLYQRLWANATNSTGWAAVMWGATDGMSGGQSTIFTVPSTYAAVAFDGYNTKKGRPTNTTDQSVAPSNVTGSASTPGGIDVQFVRLLDTGLEQHYKIPADKGTASTMSVAWSAEYFDFHGKNAEFIKSIDIVGVSTAADEARTEATKPLQNRHSRLAALRSAQ